MARWSQLSQRDMAAERRRAAGPDRRDDLELAAAQVPAMAVHVSIAMGSEDIRDLQVRPRHEGRCNLWRRRRRQQRERARDLADRLQGDPDIDGGGVELPVPE